MGPGYEIPLRTLDLGQTKQKLHLWSLTDLSLVECIPLHPPSWNAAHRIIIIMSITGISPRLPSLNAFNVMCIVSKCFASSKQSTVKEAGTGVNIFRQDFT